MIGVHHIIQDDFIIIITYFLLLHSSLLPVFLLHRSLHWPRYLSHRRSCHRYRCQSRHMPCCQPRRRCCRRSCRQSRGHTAVFLVSLTVALVASLTADPVVSLVEGLVAYLLVGPAADLTVGLVAGSTAIFANSLTGIQSKPTAPPRCRRRHRRNRRRQMEYHRQRRLHWRLCRLSLQSAKSSLTTAI